jgi:hypothetical protein
MKYVSGGEEEGEAIEGSVINHNTSVWDVQIAENQADLGFRTKRGVNLLLMKRACELLEVKELFAGTDEFARSV